MTPQDAAAAALARQLGLAPAELAARLDRPLEELGLDSNGLMRVLLDAEQALGLGSPIELPDADLDSPRTLIAGIVRAAGG